LREDEVVTRRSSHGVPALCIFVGLLILYLSFLTKNYYWDGIYFAYLIESTPSLDASLIRPNHPFYNPFGYLVYSLCQLLGFSIRAVTVLQIINGILSSLASVVLFFVLRKCFRSLHLAVALTFLFAFSATWWKFSTDANSYIPSTLFLIASFGLLLPDHRPRPFAVAALHTIAMCFHQLAVFFFPVAILGLYFQNSNQETRLRLKTIAQYSIASSLTTFGIYWVCFYLQSGSWDFVKLFSWLTYFSPENGFVFNIKESLTHSFRGQLKLFFEGRFNLLPEVLNPFSVLLLVLLAVSFAGLVFQIYRALRSKNGGKTAADPRLRRLALLCAVWASSYLIWLFFWIPKNTFYRMFYMPALVILIGVLLTRYRLADKQKWLLPLFVTVMAISNFLFFIYPYSQVRKGTPLELALEMTEVWSENSIIYYSTFESDNMLLRYFNPTTEWKQVPEINLIQFDTEIENAYLHGKDVWVETTTVKQLLANPEQAEWLKNHTIGEFKLKDPAYNVTLMKLGR
jgi:hypothetical protein